MGPYFIVGTYFWYILQYILYLMYLWIRSQIYQENVLTYTYRYLQIIIRTHYLNSVLVVDIELIVFIFYAIFYALYDKKNVLNKWQQNVWFFYTDVYLVVQCNVIILVQQRVFTASSVLKSILFRSLNCDSAALFVVHTRWYLVTIAIV